MREERLFDEFPPNSYDEWRKAAEETLKGVPFEKRLISKTYEEIDVQPLYGQDNIKDLQHPQSMPGFPPYVRSIYATGHTIQSWDVCQEICASTPKEWNAAARHDLERGQTALYIALDAASRVGKDAHQSCIGEVGRGGVSISCLADVATLFDGIDLEHVPIIIQTGAVSLPILSFIYTLMKQQGKSLSKLRGCIGMDPLGMLAREGKLPCSLRSAYGMMLVTSFGPENQALKARTVLVEGHPYHDAGASATQELAFALAAAVEYMRVMSRFGASRGNVAQKFCFSFSVGSNYFMEIAKLRAARMLWARIVKAFGGNEEAQKMVIHVRTSAWNKTIYDPYVNMLRTTAEAFAGIVGGCNSMHVSPFDEPIRIADEFSRRIARNTQLILKEESHLDRVIDPAGGSWYIETLTDQVARKAWQLFQEVEKLGGMYEALKAGFPQKQIAQVAEKRKSAIAQRRDIIVGTNMYPNLKEKPLDPHPPDYESIFHQRAEAVNQYMASVDRTLLPPILKKIHNTDDDGVPYNDVDACEEAILAGATLADMFDVFQEAQIQKNPPEEIDEPLTIFRGAEPFEQLRKQAESYAATTGTPPRVFLANMGPLAQHKARADYSTGFLEVGGFEVLSNKGFATVEEAVQSACDSGAPIVVICSTDETYPELVPPLTQQIKQAKPDTVVILAGYPTEHVETFKAVGVDEFIHLRAHCYDLLANLQKKIGVNHG